MPAGPNVTGSLEKLLADAQTRITLLERRVVIIAWGVITGKPATFSPTVASQAQVDAGTDNTLAVTPATLAAAQVTASPGDIKMTARTAAEAGWMLCQGQSLLRATYPALFAAIGTAYGAADGTHFSIPDLRGRAPVGLDSSQTEFNALGKTAGEKTHTLTTSEIPSHTHPVYNIGTGQFPVGTGVAAYYPSGNDTATGATGGGAAHNNLPPEIVVNFAIKL